MRMKSLKDESGQVMILTLLCMTVLMGFMALAIDVGLLFRAKRNLQIAADATATATALDYYYDNSVANAKAVGIEAATENGITASTGGPTVTINSGANGEITTPYHNSTGYFEAILTQPNHSIFGGYLGMGSVTIGARAVAGTPGKSTYCVYVTQSNGNLGAGGGNNSGVGKGTATMWLQGSFDVNAAHCGVIVEGANSNALDFNGGGGTLSAGSVSVVGGIGGQASDSTPRAVSGVAPITNPLQAVPFPTPSGCVSGGSITGAIGPGCYSGDSSGNITVTNATLNGMVIFTGRGTVTFGGNVSTSASGATIDIVNGGMTESAGTVFALSAPTSGTYSGIVLMAPSTNYSVMTFEFGNSHGTLTGDVNGIIYMPSATLFLHDSGGDHSGGLILNTDLVVGQLDDVTSSLTINSYSETHPNSPLLHVSLVE